MRKAWLLIGSMTALTACGRSAPVDLGALSMGQRHGVDFTKEALSRENAQIIQSAVQSLMDACPEFSKWSSEIKKGSIGALAEISAEPGYNVYTDAHAWKNYITVSLSLRDDHVAEWEKKYGTPMGQTISFYVGGGKTPGIIAAAGGFEMNPPVGTRICGKTVEKPLQMFEAPFIPDAAMQIVDQLQ